jgi:hypothetical protein
MHPNVPLLLFSREANMSHAAPNTGEVVGDKVALEQLQKDLQADETFKGVTFGLPLKSKQFETLGEVLLTMVIHIPPAITAHALYQWINNWRAQKGKNIKTPDDPEK